MHRRAPIPLLTLALCTGWTCSLSAQSSSGPISPQPGTSVQQGPPQPKIGVRVTLVNTPVTVRDSKGHMVHTLEVKDFYVTDNGVNQKITHFDMGGDSLSLVILIETSSRIDPFLPQIRKSGILFTQTVMGADAEAAVVGFNDSVDKLQDFTRNPEQIDSTINHLKSGTSGNKLYDAMALGVEMLSGRPQPSADQPGRRRVMFLMSEGTDIGSASKFGEVLRQAQLSNVTIYSVGLSTTRAALQEQPRDTTPHPTPPGTYGAPPFPGTPQGLESDSARYGSGDLTQVIAWVVKNVAEKVKGNPLELAAAGTGGAHLPTFRDRSIESAIDEIGGELHSQYSVSYIPIGTNDTGYHEIKVTIIGKQLKVRARPGYYVAPPAS
jgi:VWFA-related protein